MEVNKAFWLFPPRLVVLVSTTDKLGNYNVAPHSEFINLYGDKHLLISVSKDHDTYANIEETREFVIGIPPISIAKAISIAGKSFPKGVSEFEKASLTPLKADKVKAPLIKECIANFECELEKRIADVGETSLFLGRIVATHYNEKEVTDEISTRMNTKAILSVSKGKIFTTINKETVDTKISPYKV
ncbi:MAG: flavin reductase family protein [Candidatus Diapherotrites archaeon]|nr:flavin reductase family protein [Candidatus Diapherotrites archaeon]